MRSIRLLAGVALAGLASVAAAQTLPAPTASTAFTLSSGTPRTAEQLAVRFDVADLAIRVLPETESIDAVATLTLTATAPLERIVVELAAMLERLSAQLGEVIEQKSALLEERSAMQVSRATLPASVAS